MLLHQAVWAVPPLETDQAGRVEQQHGPALQTGGVQRFHAEQPLHHLCTEAFPTSDWRMTQEVIEGVVNGQRRLLSLGQAIHVG